MAGSNADNKDEKKESGSTTGKKAGVGKKLGTVKTTVDIVKGVGEIAGKKMGDGGSGS